MGVITDPIADMLTRVRNAIMRRHDIVDIPCSNLKLEIARIFKEEKYIKDYKKIKNNKQGILRIYLKYGPKKEPVITELKRISTPGKRIYRGYKELPYVHHGLGVAIVSTSQGIMTDAQARKRKIGGEVICTVF